MKILLYLTLITYASLFTLSLLRIHFWFNTIDRGLDFGIYSISLLVYGFFISLLYRRSLHFIWLFLTGIFLRLVAFSQEPYTTDLYRFLSDGFNVLSGHNPYQSVPVFRETDFYEMKSMYSIALWPYFALGALLSKLFPTEPRLAFKLLAGILEIVMLIYYTKRWPNNWLIAVLWTSPLLIFENWHEGHPEMIALLPLLLSFDYYKREGVTGKALWLAAWSAAVKLQGILLLVWYRFFPHRCEKFISVRKQFVNMLHFDTIWLLFFIAINLALTPTLFFQATLPGTFSGLTMYWTAWQHSQPWIKLGEMAGLTQNTSIRILQFLLLGGSTLLLLARLYRKIDASELLAGWLGCFVFFFPVQHPWYYQLLLLYALNFHKYRFLAVLLMSFVGFNYLTYTPAFYHNNIIQLTIWILPLFFVFGTKKICCNRQAKGIGQ